MRVVTRVGRGPASHLPRAPGSGGSDACCVFRPGSRDNPVFVVPLQRFLLFITRLYWLTGASQAAFLNLMAPLPHPTTGSCRVCISGVTRLAAVVAERPRRSQAGGERVTQYGGGGRRLDESGRRPQAVTSAVVTGEPDVERGDSHVYAVGYQPARYRREVGVSGDQRDGLEWRAGGPGPCLERQHDVGSLFRALERGVMPGHASFLEDVGEAD